MAQKNEFNKIVPERDFLKKSFVSENGYKLNYRLFVPEGCVGGGYPVLLYLNGGGSRGSDNTEHVKVALPHVFDDPSSPAYSSIIVAPQCPEDKQWVNVQWTILYSIDEIEESDELKAAFELLETVIRDYGADRSRVYVTGPSMGGYGTWDLLARHSSTFAAGMPVCGGGDPSQADRLAEIPIHTFHGTVDDAVPVELTRKMYDDISSVGLGNIRYTELEGEGHGIWDIVYSDSDNIKWLYSNKKSL